MQRLKLSALLLILLAYAFRHSNGLQPGCECQIGSTGCAPNCSCSRGDDYYPYYPPKNECRLTDNSSMAVLGDVIQDTSGSFLYRTALTATSISSPTNDDLMVTVWHATDGSIDQIFGSILSRNGTLISSQPLPISDLARGGNPTISKRILVLSAQTAFIVIWIEGISGTATTNPIKARCFNHNGSPVNNVQTLLNTNTLDVSLTSYSAKLMDGGATLVLYWSSKGDRKIYLNFYDVDVNTGTVTSRGPSSQVNTATMVYNREIRPDFMQVYQSGSTTTILMLVEDMQANNANSTLGAVIWNGNRNALYAFKAISTATRLVPGATASVIGNKFVVLWNEPGNLQYSAIKGLVFDAQAGMPGTSFDFWITSNTTDMSMDLIPISSNSLLFGHTRMINRPVSSVCYQVVTWDGSTIPQTVSSDKMICVEGAYGSPETSAVTWYNGQIAMFWTSNTLNVSNIQMLQSFGHVDLNDQTTPPISPPIDSPIASPTASPPPGVVVDPPQSSDTPSDGLATPPPPSDVVGIAVGVSIGGVALIAGAVLLLLLLRRKKQKKKTKQELKSVDGTLTDFDEGKYISLPTALVNVEFTIPREKIQLQEQIAAGSFGAVYAATYNNTPVAVKVHQSDMLALDDFIRESQLALSIKPHPNVLLTLGITQLNSKTIGLVMEYCAGGSLWSQLQGHPPHSKQHIIDMLVSIASGLEHLHEHGIIHRDVAARNVLITAESHLKLADFGMSRKLKEGDGSKTNQTIGPAASMAPESIRNGTYSKKSDVWMFGILMYEILSGKKPHGSAENLVSVAIDIRETGRTPQLDAHVDSFFKELMHKCCQFDPDHRPDFEQIIEELNEEKLKGEGNEQP